MNRSLALALVGPLVLSEIVVAGAGGTISNGDVSFTRTSSGFDGSPEAHLTGVTAGSPDNLFGFGWWYRILGETEETPFPNPSAELYGSGESSIDWTNLGGGAFDAHEAAFVFDAGASGNPANGGYVSVFLLVSNNSAVTSLQISIFNYVDFDVQPNASDDTAAWEEWRALFEVVDAPNVASYLAFGPMSHLVGAHPAVVNLLNDDVANNLSNTGTPFGPGDFSAATQWNVSIPANGSAEFELILAVNTPARCGDVLNDGIFCDGFNSGNRSFWLSVPP